MKSYLKNITIITTGKNNKFYIREDIKYNIQLVYYAEEEHYNEYLEFDSGKLYTDIAYIPINFYLKYPTLIIELKYGENISIAIDQINKRKYYEKIKWYENNALLIGINYEKDEKFVSN